jgi:hypothetical protein
MNVQSKVVTRGISPDLLKPVATALAGVVTTLILTHAWHVEQTTLLISAVATFGAGYIVGPTPADSLLAKLRLSKKLLAAVIVALGTALVSFAVVGHWDEAQTSTLLAAALGVLLGVIQPPDQTVIVPA